QKLGRLAKEDFPLSPAQLAVDGSDIIDYLELKPGPWVGVILEQLWLEVLEAPSRNRREYLLSRARQIRP
ncbi:MAG: polynucleotide adenylyltransferase, partial [Firmicutes bacterium]|nr:polynucleotide adenylyltransferase [Bacillota bacterium]